MACPEVHAESLAEIHRDPRRQASTPEVRRRARRHAEKASGSHGVMRVTRVAWKSQKQHAKTGSHATPSPKH